MPYQPTEMNRYASELIHGKHPWDIVIIVAVVVLGAVLGGIVGFTQNDLDLGQKIIVIATFTVISALIAFAVIVGIRSLIYVCSQWYPARVVTAIAATLALLTVASQSSSWAYDPSDILHQLIMGILYGVFGVLAISVVLNVGYNLYGAFTHKKTAKGSKKAAQSFTSQMLGEEARPKNDPHRNMKNKGKHKKKK